MTRRRTESEDLSTLQLAISQADSGLPVACGSMTSSASSGLRVAVGIATRGRAPVLIRTLANLQKQTRPPDCVLVCFSADSDLGEAPEHFPDVLFLRGAPGLTRQRNTILDELSVEDIVVFLDDDFYIHPSYLAVTETLFSAHPNVVATTGNVLADGISGPGLSVSQACAILQSWQAPKELPPVRTVFNCYGCNMALRLPVIRKERLRFDENLPLYGWYEDVEFSRQLAPFGQIVRVDSACGVHLGIKSGRQSGVRLGYSQVANPYYLARKGRVSWTYALASMISRTLKNGVGSLHPEPWVDRWGRLRGNLFGWSSLLNGTLHPLRILDL